MRGKRKRSMNLIIIAIIVFSMMSIVSSTEVDSVHINFTLVAKTNSGGTRPDILNILKQQLVPLGINLDIIIQDWPTFVGELIVFRNFDLCYISLSGGGADPDFTGVYDENGSLNLFGYHTSMDWDDELNTGKNQWYIENGVQMIANDSEDVIDFCWEWQNYMLDKILPCLPMFVQKNNSEYFQVLFYNLKETHPVIGNRDSSPGNVEFTKGLAIRKAITYAINREEIRRVVLGDDYKVINDPINPFMGNWCNPNVVRYCHDLYVARRFFELAGYSLCGGWYTGKYTDPFPNFTDWEAVCSRNEPITPTIDVQGFTFVSSCLAVNSITMISMIFLVKRRKNI